MGQCRSGIRGHPCQHHHRPRRLDQHLQRRPDQHLQSVLQPRSTLHCRFHPNWFVSSLNPLDLLLKIGTFLHLCLDLGSAQIFASTQGQPFGNKKSTSKEI